MDKWIKPAIYPSGKGVQGSSWGWELESQSPLPQMLKLKFLADPKKEECDNDVLHRFIHCILYPLDCVLLIVSAGRCQGYG